MKMHKKMMDTIIGILLIVAGVALSLDFILKFALAALGLVLIIVGVSFLSKRW